MKSVVFIGSGNVASNLAPAIDALDNYAVIQVHSRNIDHAERLCEKLQQAKPIAELKDVDNQADFVIIAVSDDVVISIADGLPRNLTAITMHTSGSVPLEGLKNAPSDTAVFYPFQTFTSGRKVDIADVPFFIEASSEKAKDEAKALAMSLSDKVFDADSDTRRTLHLAGIFSCNFVNRLWAITQKLLAEKGIPFDVLRPLLEETLRKAFDLGPLDAQTGPARRGDLDLIHRHIKLLSPEEAQIYKDLSNSILSEYNQTEV